MQYQETFHFRSDSNALDAESNDDERMTSEDDVQKVEEQTDGGKTSAINQSLPCREHSGEPVQPALNCSSQPGF